MFRTLVSLIKIIFFILIFSLSVLFLNYKLISLNVRKLIYTELGQLPFHCNVLVPGSGDSTNNYNFRGRINAVADIYVAKKVKRIIVSGRNDLPGYDEPKDMEEALIEKGIPAQVIVKSYDAERTIETIKMMKLHYPSDSLLIVSQKAHLERALFIARIFKLRAIGFVAEDNLPEKYRNYYRLREVFARLKWIGDFIKFKLRQLHARFTLCVNGNYYFYFA